MFKTEAQRGKLPSSKQLSLNWTSWNLGLWPVFLKKVHVTLLHTQLLLCPCTLIPAPVHSKSYKHSKPLNILARLQKKQKYRKFLVHKPAFPCSNGHNPNPISLTSSFVRTQDKAPVSYQKNMKFPYPSMPPACDVRWSSWTPNLLQTLQRHLIAWMIKSRFSKLAFKA